VDNDSFREFGTIGCRVIETQVESACREMGEALLETPRVTSRMACQPVKRPGELTIEEYRHAFLHGSITPWDHNEYLRAAYISLLDPENEDLGLLEVATKFAASVNRFKQRNFPVKSRPESRYVPVMLETSESAVH
jgi:hypothetical protein